MKKLVLGLVGRLFFTKDKVPVPFPVQHIILVLFDRVGVQSNLWVILELR